eukprot:12423997-Karenia_brevis.AAC.1
MYNSRNVLESGKTPHEERYGFKFGGPFVPYGAEDHYKPASPKGLDQPQKYGEKVLSGIVCGYHQQCGGGWDES